MSRKHSINRLYGYICGEELQANPLHFQYVAARYFRRDIRRDGPRLKGKVLDLGCGNQPYRPYLTQVERYVGLDYPPSRESMDARVKPDVFGDGRELPFADDSFEGVLCSQVLEHVDQPDTVIRELARVLKPGGTAIISVPFFYNLHMEPDDYYRFSPYALKSLLARHGLVVRDLRGQGGIGTLLVQLWHNWLFSGLARLARRHPVLKGGLALSLPVLLMMSLINNLGALALDALNRGDLRFAPNLWLVAEKPA
jgi:SAM-dependent methyltransferase